MTAILRMESRNQLRGSLILTGSFIFVSVFFLAVFPAMQEGAEAIEEAFPEYMMGLLGMEELHTMEGFLGGYVYPLIWIIFGGIYFAYVSAGMIAGDIRTRRMDLTLSNPVSRESVVLQKLASLWVPLVVLNVGLGLFLFAGMWVLDELVDPVVLVLVHLLSVPYFLVCAGIGIVLSVVVSRVESAQVTAIGLVFLLWLVEGLSDLDPDFEWIGAFTPHRYFDATAILVHEEFAFADAGILLAAFLVLVGTAAIIFIRRDI